MAIRSALEKSEIDPSQDLHLFGPVPVRLEELLDFHQLLHTMASLAFSTAFLGKKLLHPGLTLQGNLLEGRRGEPEILDKQVQVLFGQFEQFRGLGRLRMGHSGLVEERAGLSKEVSAFHRGKVDLLPVNGPA